MKPARRGTAGRPWWIGALGALAACGAETPPAQRCAASYQSVVAASDYSSSGVGALSLDGGSALGFGVDLGKDPALAESRGRVFFVARDLDTIFELDRACGAPVERFQLHVPSDRAAVNPQDVAVAPDGALWVPLYNVPALAVLRGAQTERIDLSSLDPDGNPQASAIRIADVSGAPKAFVALEMLDADFKARRPSKMVRLDVATRALEATRELLGKNPFGAMHEAAGAYYLAAPGNFDAIDEASAGVERFDPATFSSVLLVSERDLGGSAVEVAVDGACGAAIVADASSKNATALVTFDVRSGRVLAPYARPVLRTDDFDLRALAWRDGALLVGDRRRAAAGFPVHVLDRVGDCELRERAAPVSVSQKPIAIR